MIDISKYDIENKRQILRNCVEPEVGLHIFQCSLNNDDLFEQKSESLRGLNEQNSKKEE